MLQIFGGLLFLGVSREQLAPLAPCRRALRRAQAEMSHVGPVTGPARRPQRHLHLVDSR